MTGTILTNKGIKLIAKILASNLPLTFTRVAVGTGAFPSGYNPAAAIGLNNYKMDGEISETYSEGEEATVIFQVGAQTIEEGFIITEAGLYAQDPDEGEILYAYLSLADSPEYVYANNEAVRKFVEIEFKTIIGAVERVNVIMSPNALITKEEFEKRLEKKVSGEGGDISETVFRFEDYSSEGVEVPDARSAISKIISGITHNKFVEYTKAALMGLVTLGEIKALIVNNGLCTEPGKFFLDAAYGKTLTDMLVQQKELLTQLNSEMNNRTPITDLIAEANKGANSKRIVQCSTGTLNTPFTEGLTSAESATAYINMSTQNYGTIIYVVSGLQKLFLKSKTNGTWSSWRPILTDSDLKSNCIQELMCARGTLISSNSNLNDYKTPGVYYCQDVNTAKTLTNSPLNDSGYRLEVITTTGNGYWFVQKIIDHALKPRIFMRACQGGNFSSWSEIAYK